MQFREFCNHHAITPTTTSPEYPQARALAEKSVQTAKKLIKKSSETKTDLTHALLEYRNTPVKGLDTSPSQLLMSRMLKTDLPMADKLRSPIVQVNVPQKLNQNRARAAAYYNRDAKPRDDFHTGDKVYYKKTSNAEWRNGIIFDKAKTPRSYLVQNSEGVIYRRNKTFIKKRSVPSQSVTTNQPTISPNPALEPSSSLINTRTLRSKDKMKPPTWHKDYIIENP